MKTSTKDVLAQDIIDGLRKRIAELEAENNELQAWVDGYREHGTRVLNANKENRYYSHKVSKSNTLRK